METLVELYPDIYLTVATILTLLVANRYSDRQFDYFTAKRDAVLCFFVAVVYTLFIGLRPPHRLFVDTINFYRSYISGVGSFFVWNWDAENFLFDNIFSYFTCYDLGFNLFLLLCSSIYFLASYIGIKKIFPNHVLEVYLMFLGAFSTYSYGTNGFKAGAACSLFILAMGYRDKLKICIPLLALSLGFHHSMQLPIGAFVLTLFFKNSKWFYYGWLFCFFVSLFHISYFSELFAGLTDQRGADYLLTREEDEEFGGVGGFRLDFVLYSSFPVIFGYYNEIVKNNAVSKMYQSLQHLYLCSNGVWMLCMYASFTNRIAYLSWFLYPIVLIYPFTTDVFDFAKRKQVKLVMILHLSFTVFMNLIFYKYIK